jgi:site-specific DNA-methyltransferase (adenine-specific)
MEPYYQDKYVTIYNGNCHEILPSLDVKADLVLTDPPYGIDWDTKRYKKWNGEQQDWAPIENDNQSFDPTFLLQYQRLIIWGGNNFADKLPIGGWIVWDKRVKESCDKMFGSPFELAWCSNRKCFKIIRVQHGGVVNADSVHGNNQVRLHPTQKPILVMSYCIELATKENETILDPFLGSGTTCYCAKKLNRYSIGIEIEEKYCEIAAKRCSQEVMELNI